MSFDKIERHYLRIITRPMRVNEERERDTQRYGERVWKRGTSVSLCVQCIHMNEDSELLRFFS